MNAMWVDTSPKITVYMVQVEGCCGPIVWDSLEDALTEIETHAEEREVGERLTLEVGEMTQNDFDSLQEFEGY